VRRVAERTDDRLKREAAVVTECAGKQAGKRVEDEQA